MDHLRTMGWALPPGDKPIADALVARLSRPRNVERHGMTKRQREVLDFIKDFIRSHRYSPSLEEIARHFGKRSASAVHVHVKGLEANGLIRRDHNRSRSIEVLEP